MTIYKGIGEIISHYSNVPATLVAGNKVNPMHIIRFTDIFKTLDLKNEELLLASYDPAGAVNFILTDKNFYYNDNQISKSVSLGSFRNELLQKNAGSAEAGIVSEVIGLVLKKRTEARKTLDSFVDKYKNLIDREKENFENKELFFDGKYVEMLLHESGEVLDMCRILNNDAHFIQSLNLIFSNTNEATDGFKAEHLVIADLIHTYKLIAIQENEKAMFTLAYFFERLQGNNFANGISIERLNEMVTRDSFRTNIGKIKAAHFIQTSGEYQDEFLLPSILFRIEHELFMKSGNLLYRFASLIAKSNNIITEEEKVILKNILEKTAKPRTMTKEVKSREIPEDDSLEKVMVELNNLIGLAEVKKSISDLVNLMKIEKIRLEKNLENVEISLHSVFLGPPGTGKTTVARLLGRIYKHLGYLEKGHLVETDRAGLVAGFVGQTAIRVNEIVNESMGGVLFIDEAYSLAVQDGGRDFGQEAVDTLVKRMEDYRKELVVVVAGYTEPLKFFVESNPGLRSRFNRYFMFNHFYPQELLEIMKLYCKSGDFVLSEAAADKLMEMFEMMYEKRDEGFGNARVVRNIFERCIQNQANRLVNIPELTVELLQNIDEEDVPEPKYMVEQVYFTKSED
ncbi:MAG: AAA family ATPase [Bacteroidales bacterium]|nr:AAA family ATPase [Bacteroidales bacterium]